MEHEYGIYGGEWGSFLLDLVEGVETASSCNPAQPLPPQTSCSGIFCREFSEERGNSCDGAEHCSSAFDVYSVDREKIVVIHHGVPRMNLPLERS